MRDNYLSAWDEGLEKPAAGGVERVIDKLRSQGMTPEQVARHLQDKRDALRRGRAG